VQSRLLKECSQLISQTACGLTLIFDLICVMFPAICLLHIALNLRSLLHMLILHRFSLLFLPYTSLLYFSFVSLCVLFLYNFSVSTCSLVFTSSSIPPWTFFSRSFVICLSYAIVFLPILFLSCPSFFSPHFVIPTVHLLCRFLRPVVLFIYFC